MTRTCIIIERIFQTQQRIQMISKGEMLYYEPNLGATDDEIRKVEKVLGFSLHQDYVALLKIVNGWKEIQSCVDLLGTADFIGKTNSVNVSLQLLAVAKVEGVLDQLELDSSDVIPIAISPKASIDIFLLIINGKRTGNVEWIGGAHAATFQNINTFLEGALQSNELMESHFRAESA